MAALTWHRIETAPKDGTMVLLYVPERKPDGFHRGAPARIASAQWLKDQVWKDGTWACDYGTISHTVAPQPPFIRVEGATHWMPILDPPKPEPWEKHQGQL